MGDDLQWSHGPSAMDTWLQLADVDALEFPSMEPWPFSHGYAQKFGEWLPRRFPSMEPWPFSHGYAPRRLDLHPGAVIPSMEPWPFSHGYEERFVGFDDAVHLQWSHGPSAMDTRSAPPRASRPSSSFNGAMALQPWIPFRPAARRASSWPFNGAMALQPWILVRTFSADISSHSFNGAMALQPWIHRPAESVLHLRYGPSMEPWPFSHGYPLTTISKTASPRSLQWSHGPSAMDTEAGPGRVLFLLFPSMEPWPFSHGYVHPVLAFVDPGHPSMEPWPFSHGYFSWIAACAACKTSFNGAMALQPWIPPLAAASSSRWYCLQWSHGPSAMDT